jgi:isochorismate pyruvate lyase
MSDDMPIKQPNECNNMEDVRSGVDALDGEMVRLLGQRFAYMDAAARIKVDRNHVRDEARKTQVLDNVESAADVHGIPSGFIRGWWEQLVEMSIAYELQGWDDKRN